jgi:hypothetical protein
MAELRTVADLHRYTQELAARRAEDDPLVQALVLAKQTTWLFLLTGAFLCFHLLDRLNEAIGMLI